MGNLFELFLLCVGAPVLRNTAASAATHRRCFASWEVSIVQTRSQSATHSSRSELRPLVVAREAPRRRLLGTRLVWKQNRGQAGFHLIQPYQARPGCRRHNPIVPTCCHLLPLVATCSTALHCSATATATATACTLNLNLQLHECSWPCRHQISTDLSPSGHSAPRIMLPLYPSTPRASRRSGSQWHGSRDTWRPHPAISNIHPGHQETPG
jgi:hypothetical protein